jgi:prepilin-type N-terminal cleavage/methylation domain-containing protein
MNALKTLFTRLRDIKTEGRHNENGFTLIEMLVVILLIGIVSSAVFPIMMQANHAVADANNPESCFNQGETAERLCQIHAIAVKAKGENEVHAPGIIVPFWKTQDITAFDRNAVLPAMTTRTDPSSLVWQVGTTLNGDVCIVGYDLNDSTSKFTHDRPFIYATTYEVNSRGIGCGTKNADGTYTWANDPTVAKPVHTLEVSKLEPVRVVGTDGNVINGSIDAIREGQTIYVVVNKSYGAMTLGTEHGYITVDASYVCSTNGYTKTERMQLDVTESGANASWQGNLHTYGGIESDAEACNPKSVSLFAVTGEQWTLGNTEKFTLAGAV